MNCWERITLSKSTEMRKVSNNMSPAILNGIFTSRATPYNLRNPVSFRMPKIYSACNVTETLSHLGPKIWELSTTGFKGSLYHLVILDQKPKNGLHLIAPADYAKNVYIN